MGTDNLFHKRKAESARDSARKKGKRDLYDRVLIVCEGKKTEPGYFTCLQERYAINLANVTVVPGSAGPGKIVQRAVKEYQNSVNKQDAFDKVYCVFDKDGHGDYDRALSRIKDQDRKIFKAITSVPCFEYWLLLHYKCSTKPYNAQHGKSAGRQVVSDLKKHYPKYRKNDAETFLALEPRLPTAITNAKRSLHAAKNAGTDNPSTKVHQLVEYLQKLRK